MIIIGSTALADHCRFLGINFRRPQDLDIMCTRAEMLDFCQRHLFFDKLERISNSHYIVYNSTWLKGYYPSRQEFRAIEFQIAEESPATTAYLANAFEQIAAFTTLEVYGETTISASLQMLYSLKRSHRFLARHWEKHIRDYHLLKTLVNGVDSMPEITKLKTEETKHTKHSPSLNKSKDEFFNDDVSNHTFEHDEIHHVMAHREWPMFTYIADSSSGTVKSSKQKFFELTYQQQIQCVLEEAYVIALERGILPMLYEGKKLADAKSAFQWSMMRICTTLTSGYFREFSVEHYPDICESYDPNYVDKFLKAVDNGYIKRICAQEPKYV
jgi:hypothetical protein